MPKKTFKKFLQRGLKVSTGMMLAITLILFSCYPDETLNVDQADPDVQIQSELDQYINDNFVEEYNMAIRYKFVDFYVEPGERVTPPRLDVVRPMLDFIEEFWIQPYLEVPNGEEFFRRFVPAEIILLGGLIYNGDGTVKLGTADAGARITFTNVNAFDVNDDLWLRLQFQTLYHEFAHTVHQNFKLPNAFETIAPAGYTSAGSWFTLSNQDALERGFVSPYATSSPDEDFAETVAFFLFDGDFDQNFMELESDCETATCINSNEGKERISEKLAAIKDHYENVTGVNLDELRAAIQARING